MTHEDKKTAKIVEELTMFFFSLDATFVDTRIEKQTDQTVITFEADFDPAYADRLEHLDRYLKGQKNDGMEDIYWELAGSGDPGETSQLLLVGIMTDRAEIIKEENRVKITLYKKTG